MASINRLAIRGVRSFSPNDEEQCLEFYFPFTVIAGSNGCGKTTIIESIKYAITGALPPGGSKAGQNFVHDPRAIGATQVKAQVKLRFTSRSSQSMVVVRSMEVNQKKTTASFKQLDGALRSFDIHTGQKVTLSHKCGELDKQIPQVLGISKAILDHVLFCHQEDSSWPLAEASVLKKRFDEIFDSTRYSKAIAIFKQTEKDMNARVKELKAELAGLKSHQHAAHGFRKELGEANEAIEELDEEKKRIDQEITVLNADIQKYADIQSTVQTAEAELDAAETKKVNQLSLVTRLRSMLEEDMTGTNSLRDLEKSQREYDAKVANQKEELEDLKSQDDELNEAIRQLRRKEMELTQEKARLDADREGYEQNCRDRYKLMESVAQTYTVDVGLTPGLGNMSMDNSSFVGSQSIVGGSTVASQDSMALGISSEDMQAFMEHLEKKENELTKQLRDTESRHQASEDKLLSDLADLNSNRSAIEAEREKINKMRREANQELKVLSSVADGPIRVRKSDVDDVRRRVEKIAAQRDEANTDPRREEIPTEIRRLEEKVDSIKRQIEDDRIALDNLRLCADAENQISMLREQCTKDTELLEETIRDNSYSLQKFNLQPTGDMPGYNDDDGRALVAYVESFVDKSQAAYTKAKTAFAAAEDEVEKSQRLVNEKSAISVSRQQNLQSMSARISTLRDGAVAKVESTIAKILKYEADEDHDTPAKDAPINDFVSYLDDRLKTLDEDSPLDDAEYSSRLLKKLRKLAKKKSQDGQVADYKCPCCARSMDDEEFGVFKDTMKELMTDSSLVAVDEEAAEKHNATKEKYSKWRKTLSDYSSDLREYERLQKEHASAETEVQSGIDEIATLKSTLVKLKDKSTERRNEMDEIRELVESCKRWADDAHRIKEKRVQINQKNDELTMSATTGRDLRTVEKELQTRLDAKEEKIQQINKLNKEMTELNNRVANLATQTSSLENLLREKEAKFAESEKATERKNELLVRLQKAKEDEAQLQDQLVPLTRRIEAKTREKERSRSARDSEVKERRDALMDFQGEVKELRRLTSIIESFQASGKLQQLEEHANKVATLLSKIDEKQKKKDELAPDLQRAAASVENQERYKKLLRENIDVINEEEKIKNYEEEAERLKEEIDKIEGADEAAEKLDKATRTKEKLVGEKARYEGRWFEVVEQIRSLKRKLGSEEYRDVDEQFRVANIKCNTTEMASKDIKRYYTAVEQALLKYHTVKIEEINKIIRELWLLTYKGEDISNIEIESGHESGTGAKKTYNYRVVMTKGGNTAIDMRGRCSAGQRVLACIVIRLALAETFGVNCGCIALDEPTVNLDYRNKKGLAVALAQIVASRSHQSNFQLITITHDEEFISLMKTELAAHSSFSMPEKFFRVHREMASDGKYYSKITATDWEEIV